MWWGGLEAQVAVFNVLEQQFEMDFALEKHRMNLYLSVWVTPSTFSGAETAVLTPTNWGRR